MPDVGVLELKIESNATAAAGGLTKLANGLSKAGANAKGFDLSNVKDQIAGIVNSVKDQNSTVKSLGTLINAIAGFKKVEKIKFDAEPLKKLKEALGDGISLGQAGTQLKQLREALEGEWNTGNATLAGESLKSIADGAKTLNGTNLGTKATQISKLAGALAELADSCKKLQDVKDTVSGTSKTGGDLGISGVNEQGERVSYKMGLQFFAGRKSGGGISASNAAGDWRNSMNGVLESAKSAPKAGNSLNELAAVIKELNALMGGNHLQEYADGLKQINEAINSGAKSYLTLGRLATSVTKVKEAMQGFKIPSFGKLIELAQALQENYNAESNLNKLAKAMSAMKAASDGFKTPSAKGVAKIVDAVNGAETSNKGSGITTTEAVEQLKEDLPEVSGLFENVAEQTQRIEETISDTVKQVESGIRITGNLSDEFLKMHQELVEKYKANPAMTLEDYYFGRRPGGSNGKRELMSEWLHGQGTKGEQKYALEEMGRQFNMSVDEVKEAIGEIEERYRAAAEAAEAFANAAQQVNDIIQMTGMGGGYSSAFGQMFAMWNDARMSQSLGSGNVAGYLGGAGDGFDSLQDRIARATDCSVEAEDALAGVDAELKQKKKDAEDAAQGFTGLQRVLNAFNSIKNVFNNFTKPLRKLGNEIWRILRRMAIRWVIRQITSGVKEGVENMYWYSKAINSSFAPAMDSAATSLLQMKNSIGAALAPLLQSLIPVLQTVVNWFIEGVNYVNQFFALLNGQSTWTRALPSTTSAFEKQEKATKKASNAIKDLLADWDELNIIQSESGNGADSSGKKAVDYLSMFEEVGTFENRIKKIVDYIKDNFDTIKTVAAGIGAALLAWRVSSALDGVFENVRQLSGGLIMSVIGFTLSADAGARIADEGMTPTAVIEAIGGLAASALGGYWVAAAFFGPVGGLVGGVAGLAIGLGFLVTKFAAKTAENAYGTIEEDAETIRKNVLSYFNPNVEAEVNVLKARIKEEEEAKTKVTDSLKALEGSYPINVSVNTKETREQLKTDISNLIANTKALILLRKQNIRIPITLSGQYGDADNLVKFSDQQWDKTKAYVENIGKEMGEIISKGITDGARLDELQMKLSRITRAITYGKNSANFAGNISLAGANLRNNGYTQQTIKGYIDTYLNERNNMQAVAEAAAMQEYEELGSLFESVKERYINGDATYDEYKTARDMFNRFDIAAEVNRYLKESIGTGNELFGRDLAEGLSKVMETTANLLFQRYDFQRFATEGVFQAGSSSVNAFALQKYLWDTIATETGLKKEKLQEILGLAGINPIDLFPPDFVENIRSGLIKKMERSKYSDEQKREILSALGLSTDNISSSVQKAVGEVQAPAVDDSTFKISLEDIMAKAKETVETAQKYFSWLATPNTTAGLSDMVSATDDAINTIEEKVEELGDYSVKVNTDALRDMINSAFADDYLSGEEKDQIISQFGYKAYQAMLKELGIMFEDGLDWGYRESGGIKPIGMIASNGMTTFARSGVAKVGVGTAQYNPDVLQPSAGFSQTDLANGVEAGTKKANETQNDLIRQLVTLATRIANKDFSVNVTPNSNWGAHNSKSTAMWESVTGG